MCFARDDALSQVVGEARRLEAIATQARGEAMVAKGIDMSWHDRLFRTSPRRAQIAEWTSSFR